METINEKEAKKAARAAKRAARQAKYAERAARAGERQKAAAAKLAELNRNAHFEGWALTGRKLSKGLLKSYDVAGAVAEFEHGANVGSRVTVTRLALTGIFAFGLKKDRNKVYVLIEFPDRQQELIEAKAKDEKAARKFASSINAASRHYAEQDS